MLVEEEFAPLVRSDSTVLLRPRTGLQDMTLEIETGTEGEQLAEGSTIPLSQTEPNVQPDQILATLDGDTRAYLQLLLQGAGDGLGGRGKKLSATFRRFEPLSRDLARIGEALAVRRANIRRSITTFKLVSEELGANDTRLSEFVDSSNAALGRVRRPGGGDPRVAPGAAEHAHRDPLGARERRAVRQRPRPVVGGPDPRRAGARPGAARGPAAVREHDPGASEPDPPVRARGPDPGPPPDPGGAAAADHDQGPARHLHRVPDPRQRARLQPARLGRGGLPVLARLAQPQHQRALLQPGRDGPDAAHRGHVRLPDGRPRRGRRRAAPVPAHAAADDQRPELLRPAGLPAACRDEMETRPPTADEDPGRRRLRALVLRAGAVPVDRLRRPDPAEARGLPVRGPVRRGDPARPGVGRADLRRLGRQGEGDRARRRGRRGGDGRARSRATRRSPTTPAPPCVRRRCWARPTSSSARAATRPSRCPRAATCRARRSPSRSSSTRSSAPSTPAPGPRSASGCRVRPAPCAGAGEDLVDRDRLARLVRGRGRRRAAHPRQPGAGGHRAWSRAAPRSSGRCPSARASSPA